MGSLYVHTGASGSLPAGCWPHSLNYEHHLHQTQTYLQFQCDWKMYVQYRLWYKTLNKLVTCTFRWWYTLMLLFKECLHHRMALCMLNTDTYRSICYSRVTLIRFVWAKMSSSYCRSYVDVTAGSVSDDETKICTNSRINTSVFPSLWDWQY